MRGLWRLMKSAALVAACAATLSGCRTTRHVADGEMLLDRVHINVLADSTGYLPRDVQSSELINYLRQQPNHRVLGSLKLQLMTYDLSGQDSTKWYNRWLQRLGAAPVIYSEESTAASASQLKLALVNKGYLGAAVDVQTAPRPNKKKIDVTYNVTPGRPHRVASISYEFEDTAVGRLVANDSANYQFHPGDNLNRDKLDAERVRLTGMLHNAGYYGFVKDYITYTGDTLPGSNDVALTMHLHKMPAGDSVRSHPLFVVNRVVFDPDYQSDRSATDTLRHRDIYVVTAAGEPRTYLRNKQLWERNYIEPGKPYSAAQFDRTYEALSRLGIVKSVSVSVQPQSVSADGTVNLDALVRMTPNPTQSVAVELEGTNSEGDLGFGVGVTYQHRNAFHGSELLSIKARGSYESISGDLDGLINNHYTEGSAEVAITLPRFSAPLLNRAFRRRMKASTEFALNFAYQERPEYTRIIAGAGWKYKWVSRDNKWRRTLDLLDISYVYLPRSTINFLDSVAPQNPLLRYSYEDHFIMRIGFNFMRTNKAASTLMPGSVAPFQPNIYTLRGSVESAGNLLYGISKLVGQHRREDVYRVFGIQYSQYVKAELDYMLSHSFDRRQSLAFHVGAGVAVPYGNSAMLPFEKRFYAGGANGVRGWSVRTLGPGSYDSRNSVSSFINQCGDIRLDLNVEYRAKLFWVLEGALFVDAGNVWTIRDYETQPGGVFKLNSFYKQIALAYGIGLRMDFNYFLLRLDLGMKAHNPATNQEPWPLIHPRWSRDAAFHFSVGYPF
jgi:hypothetical protein